MNQNTLWCPKLLELHNSLKKIKEEKGQGCVLVLVTPDQISAAFQQHTGLYLPALALAQVQTHRPQMNPELQWNNPFTRSSIANEAAKLRFQAHWCGLLSGDGRTGPSAVWGEPCLEQ